MIKDLESELKIKFGAAISHYEDELKKTRTGRANPAMLEGVMVEVYGQRTPLPHIARILATDAKLLTITPYDTSNIEAISKAIREDSSLGVNPADDGKVIRVPVPEMTTQRRQEIVKQVFAESENAKISLRNARHDVLETAKSFQKEGDISEDDYRRFEQTVKDEIDSANSKLEEMAKAKEKEIMTI